MTYYNEFDPFAANWLRNLSSRNLIAPGSIDDRSITEVLEVPAGPAHFFAGIGVWSYALRLAGVPDDFPVWTGSCPCQPFSAAGKRKGEDDERHLWPEFRRLIAQHQPPVIFGEQVASKAGRTWMSSVRADLEALGYAVGAADLCAAGAGGPHVRQRIFFGAVRLADPYYPRLERHGRNVGAFAEPRRLDEGSDGSSTSRGLPVRMGNADSERREGLGLQLRPREEEEHKSETSGNGEGHGLGNSNGFNPWGDAGAGPRTEEELEVEARPLSDLSSSSGVADAISVERPFGPDGPVVYRRVGRRTDWLLCRDPTGLPRWRPVEPGTLPMVVGPSEHVGRLRGYGNAIVAPLAAEFILAFLEAL